MDYPSWFTSFRPHQRTAIDEIVGHFNDGAKVVILDAPTGSGKTLIGEAVRRELEAKKALYVCSTKSLQDQFAHDFEYARVLKGRANYNTFDRKAMADDCTWNKDTDECAWCPAKKRCPYEVAKIAALQAELACTNVAYFLTECNGPGRFRGRDLVIVDEADVLEGELLRYVGLDITARRATELGLSDPTVVTANAKGAPDAWVEWCVDALEKIKRRVTPLDEDAPLREVRRIKGLVNLRNQIAKVSAGIRAGGWVYAGKGGFISFKPVKVDGVGADALWPHADRFLLMSASIISPLEVAESLGIEKGDWAYVGVTSSFPPANRPVKVVPVANMARKVEGSTAEQERVKMAEALVKVRARHPGERVLVHAVSYDLSAFLSAELRRLGVRDTHEYSGAGERQKALDAWLRSEDGVLVAPSLDRGIDLVGDKCRVVVIAKVPFPYLGDRQVSARLYSAGGQQWYTVQTVRTVVQMSGRATRNEDDFSTTYILDSQFTSGLWSKGRKLFPPWWVEALDWRDRL